MPNIDSNESLWLRARQLGRLCLAAALLCLAAWAGSADRAKGEKPAENPYSPKAGLSPADLRRYIEHLQDSPASLHERPGFAEGMLEAADRILAAKPDADLRRFALLAKLEALHQSAMNGSEAADKKLAELAKSLAADKDTQVVKEAKFYQLEQRVLAADTLRTDELPKLLEDVQAALTGEDLDARHLRIASGTVHIINRVADDGLAARSYKEFGELFAKSDDPELSAYGRHIAAAKPPESLVGKPFPLSGPTLVGTSFDIAEYRGRVVLVDFWASWCGPCKAKLPALVKLHERFHAAGFEVVGVDLDPDLEALGKFLDEHKLPWISVIGVKEGSELKFPLAEKYDIAAIPATFLLGRDGRVIVRDPSDGELAKRLEELLKPGDKKSPAAKPPEKAPLAKPLPAKQTPGKP